ncbi:MAG TPA: PucR family transcriptional regulator ligand-binding domain-containing protein [Streptosporangiaceae bacterium]|nr:PucR family transcriptional regulator ligand-binding domain-containing protein [Streptosporangiaceae bacterium]
MPRDSGRAGVVSLPGRRRRGGQVPVDGLTVREMLGQDAMRGARIIAGADGLDRVVRRLNVMTVPNIVRWTKQDEFLLTTGYPLPREPGEFGRLIEQLAAKGLAGLGVKLDEYLAEVPADAVELADRAAFPIVVIPPTSPLDDVLSQTFETIVNRQAAALARRQQIHDAFLRVALTGGGLARLSGELAEILPGADVVICDPAGYPLAATTPSAAQAPDARPGARPARAGPLGPAQVTGGAVQHPVQRGRVSPHPALPLQHHALPGDQAGAHAGRVRGRRGRHPSDRRGP